MAGMPGGVVDDLETIGRKRHLKLPGKTFRDRSHVKTLFKRCQFLN